MTNKVSLYFFIIITVISAGFIFSCGKDYPPRAPSDNKNKLEENSLFNRSNFASNKKYDYQKIYPGETVDTDSLIIGLNAAITGDFQRSGISIWRGMVLAVGQINSQAGLFDRPVQIYVRDHRYCNNREHQRIMALNRTPHAYDLVRLLGKTVIQENDFERSALKKELESNKQYRVVVRNYENTFTPDNHEALTPDDLRLARFNKHGTLVQSELD